MHGHCARRLVCIWLTLTVQQNSRPLACTFLNCQKDVAAASEMSVPTLCLVQVHVLCLCSLLLCSLCLSITEDSAGSMLLKAVMAQSCNIVTLHVYSMCSAQSPTVSLCVSPAHMHLGNLSEVQVLHEPDVDFGSNCVNLSHCLGRLADWHAANPSHFPLTIFLNQKVSGLAEYLGDEGIHLVSSVMQTSSTPGPDGYVPLHAHCNTRRRRIMLRASVSQQR